MLEKGKDVDSAYSSITLNINYCLSSPMHLLKPVFEVIGLHMALCG